MALAMARPWKHPKTGIFWLRKGVPEDLRAAVGKREEKFSLKTRDPAEAKILHAQALLELEQRWANLKAPPKPFSEREAHELVTPAYERWIDLHRDNPSEQKLWKTKFFDKLWKPCRDNYIYLPLFEHGFRWRNSVVIRWRRFLPKKAYKSISSVDKESRRLSGQRFKRPVWSSKNWPKESSPH